MAERRQVLALLGLVASGLACGGAGCPDRTAAALSSTRPRISAPSLYALPDRPRCERLTPTAVDVGVVAEPALREVSGIAASTTDPGLVWAVADSDGVVFALDVATGAERARFRLPGAVVDPEDLAVGPCPDLSGPCVFVADTGDNEREREDVAVIAFPEPVLGVIGAPIDTKLAAVWTMRLRFPEGEAVDVEALAVLPDASALLLFEKTKADEARIFVAPAPWTVQTPEDGDADNDRPVTLALAGAVALPGVDGDDDGDDDAKARRITGAAVHWSGTRLLLRTTAAIFEFERPPLDSAVPVGGGRGGLVGGGFGDLRGLTPARQLAAPPDEAQGESVSFSHDGRQILSISEVKKKAAEDGARPVLHRFDCAD